METKTPITKPVADHRRDTLRSLHEALVQVSHVRHEEFFLKLDRRRMEEKRLRATPWMGKN